jgi:hypothetical protein
LDLLASHSKGLIAMSACLRGFDSVDPPPPVPPAKKK